MIPVRKDHIVTLQKLHVQFHVHAIQAHTTIKRVDSKRVTAFLVEKGLTVHRQVQMILVHV